MKSLDKKQTSMNTILLSVISGLLVTLITVIGYTYTSQHTETRTLINELRNVHNKDITINSEEHALINNRVTTLEKNDLLQDKNIKDLQNNISYQSNGRY